jgi:hypothetical protein
MQTYYGHGYTQATNRTTPQLVQQFTFGELDNPKQEFDFWRSDNFFNQPSNITESLVANQQTTSTDGWFTSVHSPQPATNQPSIFQQQLSPSFEQKTASLQPRVRSVRRIRLEDRGLNSPETSQKCEYFTFSENRLETNFVSSTIISTPKRQLTTERDQELIFKHGNTISSIKVSDFESKQELNFEETIPEALETFPLSSVKFPLFPHFKPQDNQKRVKASTILSAMIDVKKSVSKYRNKLNTFLSSKTISETQRENSKSTNNNTPSRPSLSTKIQAPTETSTNIQMSQQEPETPTFLSKVLFESKILLEKSTNKVESVIASQRYEDLMKRKGNRVPRENAVKVETSRLISAYLPTGFIGATTKKARENKEMFVSGRFL